MDFKNITRGAGAFALGVFALNVYIGLYDAALYQFQPLHWDINWVLAVASLAAGIFLIRSPRSIRLVLLGGVVWPIVYVASLAVDVYTRLCLGGNQAYCWPSKTDAFSYLILNNPNIAGTNGWELWQGTILLALAFLAIVFALSVITVYSLRREAWRRMPSSKRVPLKTIQPRPIQPQPGQTLRNNDEENPPESQS